MQDENPRRDLIVSSLWRFGLTALFCYVPIWKFGWNVIGVGMAFLVFVPCMFMLTKPIIAWGEELGTFLHRQPHAKWHGRHYEFAGVQIRVYPVGKKLWFADTDVLKVLGQKPTLMVESTYDVHEYDTIAGTRQKGFSEEGIEKLLRASDHFEAGRMLLWIQREVVKPHRRKLELAAGS